MSVLQATKFYRPTYDPLTFSKLANDLRLIALDAHFNLSQRTLDYLFHDLLPRGGLVQTCNFIRDRSRAVRNDFTMQHITGPLAIECHDRCARFHILTLHMVRDLEQNQVGFVQMEEQQLMNSTLMWFWNQESSNSCPQHCKVSRSFMKTSAAAMNPQQNLKCAFITDLSISAIRRNAMKISPSISLPIPSSNSLPTFDGMSNKKVLQSVKLLLWSLMRKPWQSLAD